MIVWQAFKEIARKISDVLPWPRSSTGAKEIHSNSVSFIEFGTRRSNLAA